MYAKLPFLYICSAAFLTSAGYEYPTDERPAEDIFTEKCRNDTRKLCPECFPYPIACCAFQDAVVFDERELPTNFMEQFDRHSIRNGTRYGERNAVINNLNRNRAIETLQGEICQAYGNCTLSNKEDYTGILAQWVLDETRFGGVMFCPPGDEAALKRFGRNFDQSELLTLLLMVINSQSLMVRVGSQHNLPVPSFQFQGGFILVEHYDGEPLTNFYQSELYLRMRIAMKLITAILDFDTGADNFRFVLMDLSPDSIYVHVREANVLNVTFVALENIVIHDDLSPALNCTCPSVVPECICTCRYSEMNLYAVCKLLLEDEFGNVEGGFLHNPEIVPNLVNAREFLQYCTNCTDCAPRQETLTLVHDEIQKAMFFG